MFAYLKGNFVYKSPALVHIDVNGVGYEVHITLNSFTEIQHLSQGTLHTYLHIREDAHLIYGFFSPAEKEMFLMLLSVNGIGAATARMMLSSVKPEEISRAILQGNVKVLEGVKGIGKKTAERIVLELRDKLGKQATEPNISPLVHNTLEVDAFNALLALGIARSSADQAVKKIMSSHPVPERVEEIIKKALKIL